MIIIFMYYDIDISDNTMVLSWYISKKPWYYHDANWYCPESHALFGALAAFHAVSGVHVWEAFETSLFYVSYMWSFVCALRLLLIAMWKWLCLLCYGFAPTQINPSSLVSKPKYDSRTIGPLSYTNRGHVIISKLSHPPVILNSVICD